MRQPVLSVGVASAEAMRALGGRLAAALQGAGLTAPVVVGLSGGLGAGKTSLVGGLLAALGHEGPARSRTYSLIEPYRLAGRDLYHCDLYRLRDPSELEDLGLRDLLAGSSVLLLEWPERAGDRLPNHLKEDSDEDMSIYMILHNGKKCSLDLAHLDRDSYCRLVDSIISDYNDIKPLGCNISLKTREVLSAINA